MRPRRHRLATAIAVVLLAVAALGATIRFDARRASAAVGGSTWLAQGQNYVGDFPDPSVLRVAHTYYAFGTTTALRNIPLLRSGDAQHWTYVGDALPVLPRWAEHHDIWAPGAAFIGHHYVLYYAAPYAGRHVECISVAVASRPEGPYVDRSTKPMVCQATRGGSIDPFPLVENHRAYLLWKSEGVAGREPARLWSQLLSGDGMRLLGAGHVLLQTRQRWEQPTIENPAMLVSGGRYYLTYSANAWTSSTYATGWAACASPIGPCLRAASPLMTSTGSELGPGGASITTAPDGRLLIVYHAWTAPAVGYWSGGARSMHTALLEVTAGRHLWVGRRRPAQP